jgi:citrate/tricarballylate utilization protein
MPHNAMALLFGAAFLYAILALALSVRSFWRGIGGENAPSAHGSIWQAIRDAASLRYLDGGGAGCLNAEDAPKDMRKHYHHATFYGFVLCFAATCVATAYHYVLGREAPYPWYDLPVVLGTIGGIGLVVGPVGLLIAKARRAKILIEERQLGMDVGFTVMLLLTAVTGLLLLVLRQTSAMNALLAVHLGVVFALFITLPYGKFVHGIYRFTALVRYAQEQRAQPH